MFFLSSYMWPKVVKQYIFFSIFCSMCVQIFSWQCLLLPVLPSYSKYGAESEISERSAAIPHQKDRLWSRHEDQMHQRWGGGVTQANSVPQLVWLTLPLTSINRAIFFSYLFLITLSMIGQQACPSTLSMATSLCAPLICSLWPTWTQTLVLLCRCQSRRV